MGLRPAPVATAEKGLQDLPVVTTENDICRDDLRFEFEVDALSDF